MDLTVKPEEYSNSLIKSSSTLEKLKEKNGIFFKIRSKLWVSYLIAFAALTVFCAFFFIKNRKSKLNFEELVHKSGYPVIPFKVLRPHDKFIQALKERKLENYLNDSYKYFSIDFIKDKMDDDFETVNLEDVLNMMYFGEASVGSNEPDFVFIFDTGSSNVWVPSVHCKSESCINKNRYDSTKSATYLADGKNVRIEYGSGTIEGFFSKDVVKIGHLDVPYTFIEVTNADELPIYDSEPFDGIFGLGWKKISEGMIEPIVVELKKQNKIESGLFTFFLPNHDKATGYLTIGKVDENLYVGDLVYEPLSQQAFWQVTMDAHLGDSIYRHYECIVDSGTNSLILPTSFLRKFFNKIGAIKIPYSGFYVTECNKKDLPVLEFTSEQNKFTLEPHYYLEKISEYNGVLCIILMTSLGDEFGERIVLGDPFMRKYFTVFDYDNSRIGFALSKTN